MKKRIKASTARRIISESSGIGLSCSPDADGTLQAIERLGAVQIDTISVVERAHHHALWTRNPGYEKGHIDLLEAPPRRIIEYWSHAAAYLPIRDYRFCLPRMARIKERGHQWFRAEPKAVEYVRDKIRAEGPLRAQDFSEPMRGKKGWWDWKPSKIALEYLFHAGELVSVGRQGFQKVYDLAERALPPGLDLSFPTVAEMASHYIDRACASLGVFAEEDVAYMREDGTEGIAEELSTRVADGRLILIEVEGFPSRPCYASPDTLKAAARSAPSSREPAAYVLSPFDPLIIDRKRMARVFGKAYQIECYLPEAKRSFGYFALPLLMVLPGGDAIIAGRVDAKAEREKGRFLLRRLFLEAPDDVGAARVEFAAAAAAALARLAAFNGAESIALELFESADGRLERSLRAALAKAL